MSKDITTKFTKEENRKNGRNGYFMAHREKETVIRPYQYGMFLGKHKKRGKK